MIEYSPETTSASTASADMAAIAISRSKRTVMYRKISARKTTNARTMRWVIVDPHELLMVESPIESGVSLPEASFGWYFENKASRASEISSSLRCFDSISTLRALPEPMIWTCWASTPVASWKVSATSVLDTSPAGIVIFVPPSKSMPSVNPRKIMDTRQITKMMA